MTEAELRQLLKKYGWSVSRKKGRGKYYYYAVRRIPKSMARQEIFLCSAKKLDQQTEEDIVAKLP